MSSAARVTMPPETTVPRPELAGRPVYQLTVEQYQQMVRAGVFDGHRKCELIHGIILEKPVPDPPHSASTRRIIRRLIPLFPEPDWVVAVQDSITLSDSEPEPDFFAATGPESKYDARHPGPKDLVLVVEVSDTRVGFDRGTKLALYAGEKVAQYWIVSIKDRRIEVYTQPKGGKHPTYKQHTDYNPGDEVPVVVGGKEIGRIPVNELLP